ncbi:MAG: lipid-transfer protein [Dehalococcoidia bacterium]|nr:MAG: lipid-transfer protein [Dehalococcoidia bacterium]
MLDQYLARRYQTTVRPSKEDYLIKDNVAIVGIGATEFSKDSGRSEIQMACEAIKEAVDDAGLSMEDIDGLVKFVMDYTDEMHIVSALGIPNLTYFGECGWGGGASCATIAHAAAAVAAGVANCVVCYRGMNERSGRRYGRVPGIEQVMTAPNDHFGSIMAFGFATPPSWVAMFARRYMYEFGATPEQLGWVSVVCREYACMNPKAMFYGRPITIQDYMESRMIVEPLRLYDCCVDTDGAVAIILTTADRAKGLRQTPAYILGATQGIATQGEMMTSYYRPMISLLPESWYAGQELWRVTGVSPKDVDVAQFYDAFTPLIPMQLEEYGFCGVGEGVAFCEGGDRIRLGGEIPCNTSGGHLSEAYIHGMNLVAEGVRQIRGTSTAQVKDVELSLVTGGLGVPTSALLLRR